MNPISQPSQNDETDSLSASFTNITPGSTLESSVDHSIQGHLSAPLPPNMVTTHLVLMANGDMFYLSRLFLGSDRSFNVRTVLKTKGEVTLGVIMCDGRASIELSPIVRGKKDRINDTHGIIRLVGTIAVLVA